jgi:hypothetical protein
MAHLRHLLALCLVLGASPPANAGAAEEIAQLMRELDQTFNEGNLEAYMALYADNAVFAPPNVPFRIEGKDALRAYYAGVMHIRDAPRCAQASDDANLRRQNGGREPVQPRGFRGPERACHQFLPAADLHLGQAGRRLVAGRAALLGLACLPVSVI